MNSSKKAVEWDRIRRRIVRNILTSNGFECISLPPSPYRMSGTGLIKDIETTESKVVWLAKAEKIFEGKRIRGINIYIYYKFNVERNEMTVQFTVPEIDDPEKHLSDDQKIQIQQHFDELKEKKEEELGKALEVMGVWAPDENDLTGNSVSR